MLIGKLSGNNKPLKANLKQTNIEIGREKQTKTINPLTEKQEIVSDTGYELEKVIINPVTSDIDENIVSRNIRAGVNILGVNGDLQPDKPDQEKTVIPTKERQEVVADSGFELAKTIVEPIPDNFIEPSGTLDIADNGNYDVKNYENVSVNVQPNLIEKEVSENGTYNASDDGVDGYSSVKVNVGGENRLAKFIGGELEEIKASDFGDITTIRNYAFYNDNKAKKITMSDTVTTIENSAFYNCWKLEEIYLSKNLVEIKQYGVSFEPLLKVISIPASVKILGNYAFINCNILEKVIFEGQAPTIPTNCFMNCPQIMLYDFRNCTSVPTLGYYGYIGHKNGCQIVVPDALYDEWISAPEWQRLTNVVWVKTSEYVEE